MAKFEPDPQDPDPELDSRAGAMPTAVDTDTAVETEIVETPPVKAVVPNQPSGPRRIGGRVSAVLAVIAIIAIAGVAAFGYTLNQDLSATTAAMSSTEGELGSTTSTLADTTAQLVTTTATLNAATAERTTLDAQVAELAAQVANQTDCVALQRRALTELDRISELQRLNNNRTTLGSTWDKSEGKRVNAVGDALDAYYQAYSKAFDRNLSSAKAWAAKGKEAVAIIAVQAKQQLAEFGLIDRSAAEIEAAIDALELQLKSTESTCKDVG